MYDWISEALSDSSSLVTANRRLARALRNEHNQQQLSSGHEAWRSPAIYAWQDWLDALLFDADEQESLPVKINAHQSQYLWERCLYKEIGDAVPGMANLVRMARETWQRVGDWQISLDEVVRASKTADQRLFAAAAGRYAAILQRENWIDDAGLGALVLNLISTNRVQLPARVTFAGFDRERPIKRAFHKALGNRDTAIQAPPDARTAASLQLQAYDSPDAEFRAAGAWARDTVEHQPGASLAIVVQGLEQDADRILRLFREGFTPGWQYGPQALAEAANVSFGRRLAEFPAVTTALLILRWHAHDLSAVEVGHLLRSPLLGNGDASGRVRLELRLRQLPDRQWSPAMATSALRGGEGGDGSDWLSRVAALTKRRRDAPRLAPPAQWAIFVDEALRAFNWPGVGVQSSDDFQLTNRWRELLNEFARLDLVIPQMSLRQALSRLEMMATEVVFQPESTQAVVHLIGPLEASGAEFDAIWISGMTAANWPPPGSPAVLLSRQLQQKYAMPDSTPANTVEYAQQTLHRLTSCAQQTILSFATTDGDAEQAATDLVRGKNLHEVSSFRDPGWNAAHLIDSAELVVASDDVPPVKVGDQLKGGANVIQLQLTDPLSAFVFGRLGARGLRPQAVGIPASLRGNMIHDALYHLFRHLPDSAAMKGWQSEDVLRRTEAAAESAVNRHQRSADKVLRQLLNLEQQRIRRLLEQLVSIDKERTVFAVSAVEDELEFVSGAVRLQLRCDRIDQFPDNSIEILDYKTGAAKKLMQSRDQPRDFQLFVYACAVEAEVSALALVNIDSREVVFDGAGRCFSDEASWPDVLQQAKAEIECACRRLEAGDVRVNIAQGLSVARELIPLSRYTELRRDL